MGEFSEGEISREMSNSVLGNLPGREIFFHGGNICRHVLTGHVRMKMSGALVELSEGNFSRKNVRGWKFSGVGVQIPI